MADNDSDTSADKVTIGFNKTTVRNEFHTHFEITLPLSHLIEFVRFEVNLNSSN